MAIRHDRIWLYLSRKDLQTERRQLIEEGRDVSSIEKDFEKLLNLDLDHDPNLLPAAQAIYTKIDKLPMVSGYPYDEPSDLSTIKKKRPDGPRCLENNLNDELMYDKLLGAWQGRVAGCLLGKPVEGWRTDKLWPFLKDTNQFPLSYYMTADVSQDIKDKYELNSSYLSFINFIDSMPPDDDTNYTVLGMKLIRERGFDFTPEDVSDIWLSHLPLASVCTAERVAYRNFLNMIEPPYSAMYMNPYREWIGAQIRADFFGYVNFGNPEKAAEFAFRDACISHVKNGIYGEMWVAAMLAAAPLAKNIKEVIETGLSEIPQKSRLAESINLVFRWRESGLSYDEAISELYTLWDEHKEHDWCHTISNAMIVSIALLWGETDFGKSVCYAVQPGFDTDCNGATVGSVLGMLIGAAKIPERWTQPFNDTLNTNINTMNVVKVTDMANETLKLIKRRLAEK